MPNWTENTLTLRGDAGDLRRVIFECCSNEVGGVIDFCKVIPYPEGFDADLTSGSGDESYDLYYPGAVRGLNRFGGPERMLSYPWVAEAGITDLDGLRDFFAKRYAESPHNEEERKKYPTYKDLADAYKRNVDVSGYKTWYEWNTSNWGTKWNACDGRIEGSPDEGEIVMRFNTAWSEPLPIFEKLHELYPSLEIKYTAEHEGDDTITGRRWYPEED